MEASALSAPAGLHSEHGASRWLRLRSDEQLVGLFRSGSEEAFRAIHDRYRARLHAYTRQMLGGSGADAEDVLQDVFLRAYRALRADERPVSLRAWLYRVAHNRCIDALRRPVPPPAEVFEMSRTPVQDPSAETERREDLARLVADVRRLPDQQRSALLMREMDGMSYADLARALETTVPAIKSLLVRARIGLVEAVEARDADCADIRHDLAASYDRGVRASGRARRHLRDCSGCTTYRTQLRGVRRSFAALSPSAAAPGLVAKLLGLGGAGSGGAAAAGGVASGTGAVVGGGAAAAGVGQVAAVVCCAAALTGGAVEIERIVAPAQAERPASRGAPAASAPTAAAAPAVAEALRGPGSTGPAARAVPAARPPVSSAEDMALRPSHAMSPTLGAEPRNPHGTGGHAAPADAAEAPPTASPGPTTEADGLVPALPLVPHGTGSSGQTAGEVGGEGTAGQGGSSPSGERAEGGSGSSSSGSSTSASSPASDSSASGSRTGGSGSDTSSSG